MSTTVASRRRLVVVTPQARVDQTQPGPDLSGHRATCTRRSHLGVRRASPKLCGPLSCWPGVRAEGGGVTSLMHLVEAHVTRCGGVARPSLAGRGVRTILLPSFVWCCVRLIGGRLVPLSAKADSPLRVFLWHSA
jgi:hypothetical protein